MGTDEIKPVVDLLIHVVLAKYNVSYSYYGHNESSTKIFIINPAILTVIVKYLKRYIDTSDLLTKKIHYYSTTKQGERSLHPAYLLIKFTYNFLKG